MKKREYIEPIIEIFEVDDVVTASEPTIDAEGFGL